MDEDEKASRDNDHWLVNNLPKFWSACPALRGLLHRTNDTFYRCNRGWTGGLASAGPGQSKQKRGPE